MANAVFVTNQHDAYAIKFAVGSNESVSGGALVGLQDARKISGAYAGPIEAGGVTAFEKDNLDPSTTITVYRRNLVVDVTASGPIKIGEAVMISGANTVSSFERSPTSGAQILKGFTFGHSLEIATDGEVFEVDLDCG